MLSTLIPAIKVLHDLFARLFDARAASRRELFADHIEPIFEHLLKIHEDYVGAVSEVIKLLRQPDVLSDSVRNMLIERRRALSHIRRLVRDLGQTLESSEQAPAAHDFGWIIRRYFYFTIGTENEVGKTWLEGITGLVELTLEGEITREECEFQLRRVETELERGWEHVTRTYALLKADCLNAA